MSLVNFTIRSDTARGPFYLSSPTGTEFWFVGGRYYITWSGTSHVANVKIAYSVAGDSDWAVIADSVTNNGYYEWQVPNSVSTTCKIRISDPSDSTKRGISQPFTIKPQEITVASPAAHDVWLSGRKHYITWTWIGGFARARLDYSIDNGGHWSVIADSTDNVGNYEWATPNAIGDSCLVRVSNADDPTVSGTSSVFRIHAPLLSVSSPQQDDVWWVGRKYYVTWSWQGEFNDVKIDYSTNSGTTWNVVVASTNNDGGYEWQVPAPSTINGRVRVTDVDKAASADTSDEFAILMAGIETEPTTPVLPKVTALGRIGPNPMTSTLGVAYQLAVAGHARLAICDISGRVVRTLLDGPAQPGYYSAKWDGRDARYRTVPAGVYLCVLQAGDTRVTRHVTLVH